MVRTKKACLPVGKAKTEAPAAVTTAVTEAPVAQEIKNEECFLENNEGELAVDVFEDDKDFIVMAAVAGICSKDVEIQVDKDMLLIKGCRPNPDVKKNKNYFYQECHWGPFSRKVVLPENVDGTQIQAEFDKGILVVKVPKVEADNGKKNISVKES